ncbi:MAG: hypothetical protein FJ308_11095 [Planctomycetes bacterium]|nr:hypothetical protein [Planctomycetota bacterium]
MNEFMHVTAKKKVTGAPLLHESALVSPSNSAAESMKRFPLSRKNVQSMSAFTASLCVHLVLLVSMSLMILVGSGGKLTNFSFSLSDSGDSASEELTQFEIASETVASDAGAPPPSTPSTESLEIAIPKSLTTNASVSSSITLPDNLHSSAFAEAAEAILSDGATGGDGSNDGASRGRGAGDYTKPGASFFGTYAAGHRFVFVIDSSKSMLQGTRWPTLRRELIRAIQSLSPDQEFFVISFDAQAHPMFGKLPPLGKFLHPTKDNIYRLNQWVGSIVHGSDTLPATSLGIAMQLKPDAIFLLSDGEIRDNTLGDLQIYNHEMNENGESKTLIPIHTVLLHSNVGFLTLKLIADENDGVFTPVTTTSNPE